MPLIVNVLESLDLAYTESSEFEVSYYLDNGVDIVKGWNHSNQSLFQYLILIYCYQCFYLRWR